MGLDIVAYASVSFVDQHVGTDDRHDLINLYPNESFLSQADGMEKGRYAKCRESFSFGAGSYSGYSQFRNELAKSLGFASAESFWVETPPSNPFTPFINFSDCEGIIGPKTSAALLKAFMDHHGTFADYISDRPFPERRLCVYQMFLAAFAIASSANGVVKFC